MSTILIISEEKRIRNSSWSTRFGQMRIFFKVHGMWDKGKKLAWLYWREREKLGGESDYPVCCANHLAKEDLFTPSKQMLPQFPESTRYSATQASDFSPPAPKEYRWYLFQQLIWLCQGGSHAREPYFSRAGKHKSLESQLSGKWGCGWCGNDSGFHWGQKSRGVARLQLPRGLCAHHFVCCRSVLSLSRKQACSSVNR